MLVNIIRQDPNLWMTKQHIEKRPQLRWGVGGARRIGGRVEENPACTRCNGRLQPLGGETEAGRPGTGDQNWFRAGGYCGIGVGEPRWRAAGNLYALVR